MTRLDETPWPRVQPKALLFVPLGSTEQHGPHLPFTVDSLIAEAVASAVGGRRGAVVAPVLAFGSSGEHQEFPGTLSIGRDALRLLLLELVRSASSWASRVILINGHGGNVAVLSDVVPALRSEGHDVVWVACGVAGGDAHAGRTETSLMLHLHSTRVGEFDAVVGNDAALDALLPRLRAGELRTVAPSGVLGAPRGATAAEGARLFHAIVASVDQRINAHRVGTDGELRYAP